MHEAESAAQSNPRLPARTNLPEGMTDRVRNDWERFSISGLPEHLEEYLLNEYGLNVATEYAGLPIRNPWGKASGQLSMNLNQVREDVEAGLGFVVLKTVIAEDESGGQSMSAWAIKEARMVVETIAGASGETGWTITWKGRGWWQSFDEYLALIRGARQIADAAGTLIVPSCKYHLPSPGESTWRTAEYEYTTTRILEAWFDAVGSPDGPMPLEKDFSPTLAGSELASVQDCIRNWLHEVPRLIREGVAAFPRPDSLRVGLKVFNAMFDDDFQIDLLRSIHQADEAHRPDFFIYGNRLFNPDREFDGYRGVAFGGPDLSDRNLRVMTAFNQELDSFQCSALERDLGRSASRQQDEAGRDAERPDVRSHAERGNELRGHGSEPPLSWSATGNITTGKMAVEYARRGATSFQLHTFFQLPADQYRMKTGTRTQRALNELYFHPETGFVVWMEHLRQTEALGPVIRLADLVKSTT